MTDFAHARQLMVDNQLRTSAVTDRRLLAAMGSVPRERFVPAAQAPLAYTDRALALGSKTSGRMLGAPAAIARLLQLAEVRAGDIVLDIACGTGYACAVLSELASAVVGLESEADLAAIANDTLAALNIGNAAAVSGDLAKGVAKEAPFDVIIVEGLVERVPDAWLAQLRNGGRMAVAIGNARTATAYLYVRAGDDVTARAAFNLNLPELTELRAAPAFAL